MTPDRTATRSVPRSLTAAVASVLAAAGLVWGAGRSEAVRVPRTLAVARPVGAGPVAVAFPVDFLGVVWDGPGAGAAGAAGVAVRFRHDDVWGGWQPVEEDGAEAPGQFGSALVPAGDADAYDVRGIPAGAAHARAVAINTTDGPLVEVGRRRAGAAHAAPPCRSRADWGADERLMTWAPEYHPVQVLTVHHTATVNGDTDPAATVRAIYRYHAVDRGWGDIGYQYLVDGSGVVYEGRWSGPSQSCLTGGGDGSDFGHDDAGAGVTAAHVGGMNSGNLGVALLGTYTSVAPPDAQRSALAEEVSLLAGRHGLDPQRLDTAYVNPVSGATRTVPTVSGHRDWEATECPGGALYALLPSIRADAAATATTTTTTAAATTSSTTTSSTTTTTVKRPKRRGGG